MASSTIFDQISSLAVDFNYVLLPGQPLSEYSSAPWYIPTTSPPSQPLQFGQRVILVSPGKRLFFGHLKSIQWFEKSYLVILVSPEPSAYGEFLPEPCYVYLPISFIHLSKMHRIQYSILSPLLFNVINEHYGALLTSLEP